MEHQSPQQQEIMGPSLLRGPDEHDIKKIHAEITQLAHQRFHLNVVAITIFGVIMTWLIPKQLPQPGTPIDTFIFAGTFLVLVILSLLYLYSHMLRRMVHTFTTYLLVTNTSRWELDWAEYLHLSRYWGYTIQQSIMFMVLGLLAAGFPIIYIFVYNIPWTPSFRWLIALAIATIIYEVFVWCLGFRSMWSKEKTIIKKWQHIKATKELDGKYLTVTQAAINPAFMKPNKPKKRAV